MKYLKQMEEEFGLENDVRVSTLSRYPEVFTMEEQSEDGGRAVERIKRRLWKELSHSLWRQGKQRGKT